MEKIVLFFKRYKFTLSFIFLSLFLPYILMTVIFRGIQMPRDIIVSLFVNIALLLIFIKKIELTGISKILSMSITVLISILSPFILMVLFIFSPMQKEHARVMFEICLPELKRQYNVEENDPFPSGPVDKDGNGKWWFQHLECEKNVSDGKGPIFSDNPADFHPVK